MAAAPMRENQAAGATLKPGEASAERKLIDLAWWMKKQGYADSTVASRIKILRILARRGANLYDPESVKDVLARQNWTGKRKSNAVDAYNTFLHANGGAWQPPTYKDVSKLPFIPTEAELDQLIAGCGPKTSIFLQLLKETAMRGGEAIRLRWTDIDFVNRTVRVTPEKGSLPRMLRLSAKLVEMLLRLREKNKGEKVFCKQLHNVQRLFWRQRRRLAEKLKNPRLLQIHLHTFRHWKATMEYSKTKDILHVMRLLGHRRIQNTLTYTQLVNFEADEYISKVARNVEEACQLVEAGFEYVCDFDGARLFKKRK